MPADDRRLERALEAAAPAVDTGRVLERVATKRARRRTARRMEGGVLALILVLVIGATAVLTTRDDGSSPQIAAPGAGLTARVVQGAAAVSATAGAVVVPRAVALAADEGYLRGPLYVGSSALSLAAYDRAANGTFTFPPSRILRLDGTQLLDRVDLQAEVLSITDGEGARWAVTENPPTRDGTMPQTFLKRITANTVANSQLLPAGSEPVGSVAAVGGAVWVPVRDGVLQFDPASGKFLRHVDLAPASTRAVALVGKGAYAYVTDGGAIRRLDPQRGVADAIEFGQDVIGLASFEFDGRVLLPNETGGADHARVASALSGDPVRITAELPVGFTAESLVSSATRIWAAGTVEGAPAIALLDSGGVRATVILQNGRDLSLAWTSPNTVTVVSNGQRSEIHIP
jgi:hypothetical protein